MPDIDRRILIAAPIAVVVVFLIGFAIGRGTAGEGDLAASGAAATAVVAESGSQDGTDATTSPGDDPGTENTPIVGDAAAVLPPEPTDPGEIPLYGTDDDRRALITGLVEAGVSGGSEADVLATADYVCYTLERLRAQKRSLSFTVRVVWNESLAELPPEDLTAFGTVLAAAPAYLCPQYADFGERVSYWLGY